MSSDSGGLPGLNTSGAAKYNQLTPLLPPTQEVIQTTNTGAANERVARAFTTPNITPSATSDALQTRDAPLASTQMTVQSQLSDTVRRAQVCEAVKTDNIAAFDNPEFAANCGICHMPGKDSNGNGHVGGMYITAAARQTQEFAAGEDAVKYGRVSYIPTLGICPPGMFSVTKEQAVAKKERIECQKKKSFDVRNCGQCFATQEWDRVTESTEKLEPTLFLVGTNTGNVTVESSSTGATIYNGPISNTPVNIPLAKGSAKGDLQQYMIRFSGSANSIIGGYVQGRTLQGAFTMDIVQLIQVDTETGTKPRLSQTMTANNLRISGIRPGAGKTGVNLRLIIPFVWISTDEDVAATCPSPYVLNETAMNYLESDSCFKKGSGPGNYSLDCLQDKFLSAGCLAAGTAYPGNPTAAAALAGDKRIGDIADDLYELSIQSATGRTSTGRILSLEDWSAASKRCTGQAIESPCDRLPNGRMTGACAQYLYENRGATGRIGATYTGPAAQQSLRAADGKTAQFCTADGAANPSKWWRQGVIGTDYSVDQMKAAFNSIHSRANDNTLPDSERQRAINECYGAQLVKPVEPSILPKEPFTLIIADTIRQGSNADHMRNGRFILKPATCGRAGYVSIILEANQTFYISINSNKTMGILPQPSADAQMAAFRQATCWRPVAGLNGATDCISLESLQYPGEYLILNNIQNNGSYISEIRNEAEMKAASFKRNGGLQTLVISNEGDTSNRRQGACSQGMYQYGMGAGGFCCPVPPTQYDAALGDYTVCPTLTAGSRHLNGKYVCALDDTKRQGLPVCGAPPQQWSSGLHGGGGGAPFDFKCPQGTFITQFSGGTTGGKKFMGNIRAQCSNGTNSGSYGASAHFAFNTYKPNGFEGVDIRAGGYVDSISFRDVAGDRGGSGGSYRRVDCPTGIITGIYGRTGSWMDAFGVHCN
jgi:hypothetical protein